MDFTITSGKQWKQWQTLSFGAPKSLQMVTACSHEIKRPLLLGRKIMTNLDRILQSRDITLPKKGPSSQSYDFCISHVWMWEVDYKESWALKNWCFWTVVPEKTLESTLDCKESQPVHPIGNQSWIFIGRTDAEAETPILWPPGAKNWLIWKDPDGGQDWRREEKGTPEDEIVGWHHQLNGHEFEQTRWDNKGERSLGCCSPWGHKVRHDWATELNKPGLPEYMPIIYFLIFLYF